MYIPKIIHQIHLGGKDLPDKEKRWRDTWIKLNPSWKYIMWNDSKVKNDLNITYPEILEACESFSEKSDILRFEILNQYGGLYIDTDFECLKPIDPIFENKELVLFKQAPKKICGAFFGATKNNKDVKKLIDGLPKRQATHGNKIADCKYGPVYVTEIIGHEKAQEDGSQSSKKTVYPYMWWEKNRAKEDFSKTHPEAYAVHHWGGSWIK